MPERRRGGEIGAPGPAMERGLEGRGGGKEGGRGRAEERGDRDPGGEGVADCAGTCAIGRVNVSRRH